MTNLVELKNIEKAYGETPVLSKIDLSIDEGELVILLGPSGSGKTTLLNLIAGIDKANNGEIRVLGNDLSKMNDLELTNYRKDTVGYIFQFYNLLPNLTVLENAALGLELKGEDIDYATVILEKVGIEDKSHRFPAQLSGGEQTRVSIARSLANNPLILLCDEPTGNLDPDLSIQIVSLLEKINRAGTTVVMATHDSSIVNRRKKRVIELSNGKIVRDEEEGSYILR